MHHHDHDHHHHHHDLEAIDFEGEILYPEPIGSDNILIDILVKNMEKAPTRQINTRLTLSF